MAAEAATGAPEAAAASEEATAAGMESIASGDPDAVLAGLAQIPPSRLAEATQQSREASAEGFSKMHEDLAANPPSLERPTGLPRKGSEEAAAAKAEKAPEAPVEEPPEVEAPPGEQSPVDLTHVASEAPLPAPAAIIRPIDAAPEEGARLEAAASNTLDDVPTTDPTIDTSAGPRPVVETTGEADPAQMDQQKATNQATFEQDWVEATAEMAQDYGENDIYPIVPEEILQATISPAKSRPGVSQVRPPGEVPTSVAARFDRTAASHWAQQVGEGQAKHEETKQQRTTEEDGARAETKDEIARLERDTTEQQTAAQEEAHGQVAEARSGWKQELTEADSVYAGKSASLSKEYGGKIAKEKDQADKGVASEFAEAERQAAEKKRKAEADARAKKRESKEESGGFFGWLKRGVKWLIGKVRDAINGIFNALRAAVKWVIEKAKKAALWLIEKARQAIVAAIRAFGNLLMLAADVFLAAFPEARDKAKALIRKGVAKAEDAVNRAAEALKEGVAKALDALGAALDFILAAYQKAYNLILDAVEFIAIGLIEIMEKIGHLVSAAEEMPDHFMGQLSEEFLGMDLTQPLPIERTARPESKDAVARAAENPAVPDEDRSALRRSAFGEGDVAVDRVLSIDELDPALLARLGLRDGQETEFGEIDDPTRSIEGAKAEATGGGAVGPTTAGPAPGGEGLQPTPEAAPAPTPEEELQALMAREPEGTCTKEKEGEAAKGGDVPEHLKIGPLTVGQRARYLMDQMMKGIKKWFSCNWPWLLAGAVAALLGIIVLNILTGGAILAAVPLLMQLVGAIMVGVALARVTAYIGEYLSKGWQADISGAAMSLARGLAIGAVELVFALLFNLGAVIKALKSGVTATLKTAAKSAKALGTTTLKNVKALGKIGVGAAKATVKNGKLMLKGLRSGFARGARSLDDLAKRLSASVRFRKFKITFRHRWFRLLGYINPWVVLMQGPYKGQLMEVEEAVAKKAAAKEFIEVNGKKIAARVVSIEKDIPTKYRKIFEIFQGKGKVDDFVIHHLIERQTRKLTNIVDDLLLHAPSNLRAIPMGIVNEVVHLSKIRKIWNQLYLEIKVLASPEARAIALHEFAEYTDEFISHMLTFAKKQGKGLTKNALMKEADAWLKENNLDDAVDAAMMVAESVDAGIKAAAK